MPPVRPTFAPALPCASLWRLLGTRPSAAQSGLSLFSRLSCARRRRVLCALFRANTTFITICSRGWPPASSSGCFFFALKTGLLRTRVGGPGSFRPSMLRFAIPSLRAPLRLPASSKLLVRSSSVLPPSSIVNSCVVGLPPVGRLKGLRPTAGRPAAMTHSSASASDLRRRRD